MVWQPASTFSSAGELGMVLDRGHLRLPQVTDRNRKLCCFFYSFEPTVSKVVLSAGPTVLKSCYSWERLASWEGTGHVMRPGGSWESADWNYRGGPGSQTVLLVWVSHLSFWGREGGVSPPWKESTVILSLVLLWKWHDIRKQTGWPFSLLVYSLSFAVPGIPQVGLPASTPLPTGGM